MRYERLSILNDPNANPAHKPYFAPMSDDVYIFIARNFFQQLNITAITEDNFHHILDALCAYRTIYYHLGVYELVDSVNFILDELCEYLPVEPKLRYRHRNSLYRPPYEELYFSQAQKHKFVENVNPDAQEEYNNAIYGRARWCKDEKKKRYFIVPTMWRNKEKAKLSNLNEPKSTIIDEIPNEYPEEQIDKDVYDYLYLDTIRDIEASRRKERKEKYYQDIHEYSERAYKEKTTTKQDNNGTSNSKQDTSTNHNTLNSEQGTSIHKDFQDTLDSEDEDDASEFLNGPRYVRADVSNLNKDAVDYLFEIGLLVSGDKCEEQETEIDIKNTKNTKKYDKNTKNIENNIQSANCVNTTTQSTANTMLNDNIIIDNKSTINIKAEDNQNKINENTKKYTKNTENIKNNTENTQIDTTNTLNIDRNLEHIKSKEILDMVNKIKKKG